MTQYILHISNFSGMVPGAKHYRGRVEGPHPRSCHGGMHYNAPESRGKWTCADGHELPERVTWDVEAAWSEERHDRWAAARFEGDGPQGFLSQRDVMDRAVVQFLDGSSYPCGDVDPAHEGDELWYGWIMPGGEGDNGFSDLQCPEDNWGMMIARKDTGG